VRERRQSPLFIPPCFSNGLGRSIIHLCDRLHRINMVTCEEFAQKPEPIDAGHSLSSFEHDGLCRYGAPLDPDGDLKARRTAKAIVHAVERVLSKKFGDEVSAMPSGILTTGSAWTATGWRGSTT